MNTELGKIAALLNNTEQLSTLLQIKLNKLSWWLTAIAIIGGIIIFLLSFYNGNQGIADSVMVGVSLAVAAVPETLSVITTITLARGVRKMAERNTIVRKVSIMEAIGGIDIIASDKTGTLTQNKMNVVRYWTSEDGVRNADEELYESGEKLLRFSGLSNNAEISVIDGEEQSVGDATELAILRWLQKEKLTRGDLEKDYPRLSEDPFDSKKKIMTTVHKIDSEKNLLLLMGRWIDFL